MARVFVGIKSLDKVSRGLEELQRMLTADDDPILRVCATNLIVSTLM